ncbi:aldo/keto reductase, partial [Streptomyces rubiginosohelvolus]
YLGTAIDQMLKAIGMRGPYTHYGAAPEERTACAQRYLYLFRLIKPNVVWPRLDGLTPAIQLEGESLFGHGASVILAAPLAHGLLTGAASGTARCSRQRQKSLLPQPSTRSLPGEAARPLP